MIPTYPPQKKDIEIYESNAELQKNKYDSKDQQIKNER